MVEVECDRPEQVTEAVVAGASAVLLDNMSPSMVSECVALVRARAADGAGAVLVEASGGVTLDTAPAYAAAGADLISVGAITHSAPDTRPRARPRGGLNVLLAIDVGQHRDRHRPLLAGAR